MDCSEKKNQDSFGEGPENQISKRVYKNEKNMQVLMFEEAVTIKDK